MTKYLIKHTTHTTGETFTDVTKIRDNETYTVVEAESKEEAEKKVNDLEEFEFRKDTRWDTDSMHI